MLLGYSRAGAAIGPFVDGDDPGTPSGEIYGVAKTWRFSLIPVRELALVHFIQTAE